jgi:hypothetical protein
VIASAFEGGPSLTTICGPTCAFWMPAMAEAWRSPRPGWLAWSCPGRPFGAESVADAGLFATASYDGSCRPVLSAMPWPPAAVDDGFASNFVHSRELHHSAEACASERRGFSVSNEEQSDV